MTAVWGKVTIDNSFSPPLQKCDFRGYPPRFVRDTSMCSVKCSCTLGNNSEFIHPDWVARTRLPFGVHLSCDRGSLHVEIYRQGATIDQRHLCSNKGSQRCRVQQKLADQPVPVPFGSTLCQVSERLSNQFHLTSKSGEVHIHAYI